MAETSTVKKTTKKKAPVARKEAPDVVVKSPARRGSIDELCRDNPGKNFVYASASASAASLGSQGLTPVKGVDGRPMRVKSRVICEDVGDIRTKEIRAAHQASTDQIEEVKDPKQANSRDKTAVAKKPNS